MNSPSPQLLARAKRFLKDLLYSSGFHLLLLLGLVVGLLLRDPADVNHSAAQQAEKEAQRQEDLTAQFIEMEMLRQKAVEHLQAARREHSAQDGSTMPATDNDSPSELEDRPPLALQTPASTVKSARRYYEKIAQLREEIAALQLASKLQCSLTAAREKLGAPPPLPPAPQDSEMHPDRAAAQVQYLLDEMQSLFAKLEQQQLQEDTLLLSLYNEQDLKMRQLAMAEEESLRAKDFSMIPLHSQPYVEANLDAENNPSNSECANGGSKKSDAQGRKGAAKSPTNADGPCLGGNGGGKSGSAALSNQLPGAGTGRYGRSLYPTEDRNSHPRLYDIPDSSTQLLPSTQDLPPPLTLPTPTNVGGRQFGSGGQAAGWCYFSNWYFIGPFPNPARSNLETRFTPEMRVDLNDTYLTNEGKKLRWQFLPQTTFITLPPQENFSIYYFYTELDFDQPTTRWLAIGSDDASALWVNGVIVWVSGKQLKPMRPDEGFRKVRFSAGRNRILFRLENGRGTRTMFSLLLDARPTPTKG